MPEPTTFFEEVTTENVHADLDRLEAVIERTTRRGSEMEKRLVVAKSNYHGVQQLARAFKAHPDQETLQQVIYLMITNPTSITTMLFAEESGMNPERIIGPSDVDRTRYIHEMGKTSGVHEVPKGLRRELNSILDAYGPHNPLNGATRSSVRSALDLLEMRYGDSGVTDFETWYGLITKKVNDFGTKPREIADEICEDTVLRMLELIQLLFPIDVNAVRKKDEYFPESMKAQVYDPNQGMYVGHMVERNNRLATQGEIIRTALRSDLVLPTPYSFKTVVLGEKDQCDFEKGNQFTKEVLEEMKAEGLISLTVNRDAIDARQGVENPAVLPSIRSRARKGVDAGAYIAVGINDGTRKVGLFKKVDDGIEMRWSRGIQATPRSFAYDPVTRNLLVGTKDGVLAYALDGRGVKEVMNLPTRKVRGRPTGVNSITVHGDDLVATVPGLGIVTSREYLTSPQTEIVLPATDQYVGALGFFEDKAVGVSIGTGIFRGQVDALPNSVTALHKMSEYHQLGEEHGKQFAFDAWVEHDSTLYAITHDGVLVKWSLNGSSEVLSTPTPLEQLVEERAQRDPRFVVRERTKYGGELTAYCPNSLGRYNGGIIAVHAGENNNHVMVQVNHSMLTVPDYRHASHRLVTSHNGRLFGVAPHAYNLPGFMGFVDEIPSGAERKRQTLEPVGFGACEIQIA